ncbi:MAG TPA: ABC transporter permease [Vicinamibacterales bacterium]|jgi:putative ABC transport system permease protein
MNQLFESITIALRAIWGSKLRSFLTVLGNIVAVTSIIAVVSLVQGINDYVTDAIVTELGVGTFTIDRYGAITSEEEFDKVAGNPPITERDATAVRLAGVPIQAVMSQSESRGEVRYRDRVIDSVQIQGVSRDYVQFGAYKVERGRLVTPMEIERKRPVTLIGWDVADKLFLDEDPLDKMITVAGMHMRVVGVHEKKGSVFGNSQDQFAMIPIAVSQKLFGARQYIQLTAKPFDAQDTVRAMDTATAALRIERRLKPKQKDNFGLFTSDTFLGMFKQITSGIFGVLIGVVALSLVVGGIVIMNIMLMVVSERTAEIGLRKALGARKRDIIFQFLVESVTLSTMGGVVGTGLGFFAAWLVTKFTPMPASVHLWAVVIGIGMTAVVGLFFGLYPSVKAAKLDPIEALRRE